MKRTIAAILLFIMICLSSGCGPMPADMNSESESTKQTAPVLENAGETPPANTPPEDTSPQDTPPSKKPSDEKPKGQTTEPPTEQRPETMEGKMARTIQATITMEDGGVIVLELYPDLAPQSVSNFVYLARKGFYDGLKFHRIIKGFMIQGGCPLGTGRGDPGYSIKGEFEANGFANELSHTRGVISMARANDPDSAGSQFFIVHEDSPHLDGGYAAFGRVISGMDVVDRLSETPVTDNNGTVAEKNMPVMRSITIDDDIELPEPDMIKN